MGGTVEQVYSVRDEAEDYESQQPETHCCSNVEVGQPGPSELGSQLLHPAVEDAGSQHEIVGLDDNSVFVGFHK